MDFKFLLDFILKFVEYIASFCNSVLNFFNQSIDLSILKVVSPILSQFFISDLGLFFGSIPLYVLLFGSGVILILALNILKFFASILDSINPFG